MFGKDVFVLSQPKQVKTVAKNFTYSFKKVVEPEKTIVSFDLEEKPKLTKPELPKLQKVNTSNLNKEVVNSIKPEPLKTVAKTFLNQVNKVVEKAPPKPQDKLLFSYSDRKGKVGNLEPKGEKVKVIIRKNKLREYTEDIIEVYLKGVSVSQDGIYIQTKGWGNTKELAVANALKNAVVKLNPIKSDFTEKTFLNYSLSTIASMGDGGFECKVKVTPGKI